jgi:hypothetical protein
VIILVCPALKNNWYMITDSSFPSGDAGPVPLWYQASILEWHLSGRKNVAAGSGTTGMQNIDEF